MGKYLQNAIWCCPMALGAVLIYSSGRLSVRYNAWTTSIRDRHPHINSPPTPQMREVNTRIMTWIFRIFGAFLLLLSIMAFVSN
jgi:hypothetical protein